MIKKGDLRIEIDKWTFDKKDLKITSEMASLLSKNSVDF
jgi:hypothetical protein